MMIIKANHVLTDGSGILSLLLSMDDIPSEIALPKYRVPNIFIRTLGYILSPLFFLYVTVMTYKLKTKDTWNPIGHSKCKQVKSKSYTLKTYDLVDLKCYK